MWPVVSGTKTLAADPGSPERYKVHGLDLLVQAAHPIDAKLDWDLGILEGKATSWLFVMFLKLFLNLYLFFIFFAVWQGILSCWKRPLPSGNTVPWRGVRMWSATLHTGNTPHDWRCSDPIIYLILVTQICFAKFRNLLFTCCLIYPTPWQLPL